jgi:hypothetical protein
MKSLHYLIVGATMLALVGLPSWYATKGAGAEAVPGVGAKVLRSKSGRTYVGGGPRAGK